MLLALLATLMLGGLAVPATAHAAAPDCENLGQRADLVIRTRDSVAEVSKDLADVTYAIYCLVNIEREKAGVPALRRPLPPFGTSGLRQPLDEITRDHVNAAVGMRWWGDCVQDVAGDPAKCRVGNGVECFRFVSAGQPARCDPHRNPSTGTDVVARATAASYCPGGAWQVGENTYTGWGAPAASPREAVRFWMGSRSHRETMLSSTWDRMDIHVRHGTADPAAGQVPDGATYVQVFGRCQQ